MNELELIQHARAWIRAKAKLPENATLADLCGALSAAYEEMANEVRERGSACKPRNADPLDAITKTTC